MRKVSIALLLLAITTFGVVSNADGAVALCVGCTNPGQFESAAWRLQGTNFIGEAKVLVVNPDTGTSMWVYLTHTPSGARIRAKPAARKGRTASQSYVGTGVAVPLDHDPFKAIYKAGSEVAHTQARGRTARARAVGRSQQAAINTAIKLTKHTYFVRLGPTEFPSYETSLQSEISKVNYNALANAGIGWPPRALLGTTWKALLKVLKLYTGHSADVCDVFGNGASACFVPNPTDPNILTQDGPAKGANGNVLPDIANRVAGGGGGGMVLRHTAHPSQIWYFAPGSSSGGGSHVVCGYVNGVLSYCVRVR